LNYSLHSQQTTNVHPSPKLYSVESRKPTLDMNTTNYNKMTVPKVRTRGISDYCCKFGLSGNETSR
jgi:hypothetical protein